MPRKLLAIDDDRTLASELEPAFASHGFLIDHAADAESGLVLIEEFGYSLIIVDATLVRHGAITLLQSLRDRSLSTPVVVIGTRLSQDVREMLGAFRNVKLMVPKPIEPKPFAALVAALAAE